MPSIAERIDVVIGVDTHKHTHTAAIIAANGGVIDTMTVSADPDGYTTLFEAATTAGARRVWSIEGCGSWGRGLCRWLQDHHEEVIEIERPKRPKRHMGAKTDTIDAVRAGREALHLHRAGTPRDSGQRDALAAAHLVRQSAIKAAGDSERQLLALANTCPEQLAAKLRGSTTGQIVNTCATWSTRRSDPTIASLARTMQALARRARSLRKEADGFEHSIEQQITAWRPDLLELNGVGPIVAAIVLTAWSHPGRIHSPGAFAKLAGTAPIPTSSGLTNRHRLSSYGDRQLNRAIHTIALSRMRYDERTITYTQRRRTEGKTDRDIRRCIKNYIARELHQLLETPLDKP